MRTEHLARIITQAELVEKLGRQVLRDCLDAGWIKPRVEKAGKRGPAKKLYAVEDWRRVEDRILNGEYPGQ